jgi:hypothetical protein
MILTERIENWGRAMQVDGRRGRARSLEGMFRSRQPWDEPVYRWRGVVDVEDAYRVELAWGSLPDFERVILRGQYCLGWVPPKICRVVGRLTDQSIRYHDFGRHLNLAVNALGEALARSEGENRLEVRRWAKKVLASAIPLGYGLGYN